MKKGLRVGEGVSLTSKYRPWRNETAFALRSREKVAAFEGYLKSHSGREVPTKHL